jgi:hypothetical protein
LTLAGLAYISEPSFKGKFQLEKDYIQRSWKTTLVYLKLAGSPKIAMTLEGVQHIFQQTHIKHSWYPIVSYQIPLKIFNILVPHGIPLFNWPFFMTPLFGESPPTSVTFGQEHPDLVVGIDICGDPHQPTVTPYLLPALKVARKSWRDGGEPSIFGGNLGRYQQYADLMEVNSDI